MNPGPTLDLGTYAADDDLVVKGIVDELMTRVPSSTDRRTLERVGRQAARQHRLVTGPASEEDGAYAEAALVATVRAALRDELRTTHAGARPGGPAVVPLGIARVTELAAGLPVRERRVLDGYFVAERSLGELSADLGIGVGEVVTLRDRALRRLRAGW